MKCSSRGRPGCRLITKLVALALALSFFLLLLYQFQYIEKVTPQWKTIGAKVKRKVSKLVDTKPSPSEDVLIADIEERMPNLPIRFWNTNKKKITGLNSTCARFPDLLLDVEYNNLHWQTLRTTNGTFQLFAAYLDVRKSNTLGSAVRILAMLDRIEPTLKTFCQFWFDVKKQPVIVATHEYKYVWNTKWGNYRQGIYQPYLITCKVPSEYWKDEPPVAVSLVENFCATATNNLRVIYNRPEGPKKGFAVCVKGLDFPHLDTSVRLVEWIELLGLLGADKVFFYELEVHPNVSRVLKYYEGEGKVQVTPLKLAGGQPNGPSLLHFFLSKKVIHKRQNEQIPYNDCFYKHMYEYKYIVLLDTDEVIMPVLNESWGGLMGRVEEKAAKVVERASFNVRNVYFLDDLLHNHGWFRDIPEYMHMLQHVYRAKNFTKPGFYIKSFFNTEKVLILHNHYPLGCLGNCFSYAIEASDAQLQHYRSDCVKELKKSCDNFRNESVMDTTIWRFKLPLIERVNKTLNDLGYLTL